jgi:hypothetical protein
MFHAQSTSPAPDANPPDPNAARDAEQLEMLRELADGGMEFTRAMRGQLRVLTEAEPDPQTGEPTKSIAVLGLAFSRVARAVRQTLALEVKFQEGPRSRDTPSDAEARWRQEMEGAGERLRAKLAAMGFYPARPEGYEPDDADDDRDDDEPPENLADRPERDPDEGFGPDRPPGEVLAGVCADLGITRDLSVWADEDRESGEPPVGGGKSEMCGDPQASGPAVSSENRRQPPAEPATAADATGPP